MARRDIASASSIRPCNISQHQIRGIQQRHSDLARDPPVFSLGIAPLPTLHVYEWQCIGNIRIQFQSVSGGADPLFSCATGRYRSNKDQAQLIVCGCQTHVSRRKRRIFPDRLLEVSDALFDFSAAVGSSDSIPSFKVALINVGRDLRRSDKPGALLPLLDEGSFQRTTQNPPLSESPASQRAPEPLLFVLLGPKPLAIEE